MTRTNWFSWRWSWSATATGSGRSPSTNRQISPSATCCRATRCSFRVRECDVLFPFPFFLPASVLYNEENAKVACWTCCFSIYTGKWVVINWFGKQWQSSFRTYPYTTCLFRSVWGRFRDLQGHVRRRALWKAGHRGRHCKPVGGGAGLHQAPIMFWQTEEGGAWF